uniref:Uncharacterized protein n=1 Tax=Prolemur simus TaxID=1328070 RepID=A0A8C8YLH7_PROSS
MKGTLLVLALLVTGELGFKTGESGKEGTDGLSDLQLLDISLDLVNATKPEKAGFEKIQACYNERGVKSCFHLCGLGVHEPEFIPMILMPEAPEAASSYTSYTQLLTRIIQHIC